MSTEPEPKREKKKEKHTPPSFLGDVLRLRLYLYTCECAEQTSESLFTTSSHPNNDKSSDSQTMKRI